MTIFRCPINITYPGAGSPGVNVWHLRTFDPVLSTELAEATALLAIIRTFYQAHAVYFPNGTTLSLGTCTNVADQREIVPTFTAVTGSGTGSSPQALCTVVTWKTTIAARRGRGRTFLGPLSTGTIQSDGTPNDTYRGVVQAAAAALVASSVGYGNGAIGVWGYDAAKAPHTPRDPLSPRVFRDYTGSSVRDLFGVLRSRRD
jgi:hypothetical protein